jgi:trans-2,3-dihydro-3-hydroxyanthranilate isomerase
VTRRDWFRSIAYGAAAAPLTAAPLTATPLLAGRRTLQAQGARLARSYRYIHLDVFTDRRLAGNQLLVYVNPEGLDADAMTRLTRESNYSENTFVFPPEQPGTDVRVRIVGQRGEMPFAGHPAIGTAFALAHIGRIKPGDASIVFGLGIGPTRIDLEWKGSDLAFAWMTQQKPTFGRSSSDAAAVAGALGLQPSDVAAANAPAAQDVSTGSTYIIVPLASRRAVDAAVVDPPKLRALRTASGLTGFAIYAFTTEPGNDGATSYSRLVPPMGVMEDPATGSAAGPAGCFMVRYGFVPVEKAGSIVNVQGVLVRRPSRIHVRIASAGGEVTPVKVGGASVVVGEGTASV